MSEDMLDQSSDTTFRTEIYTSEDEDEMKEFQGIQNYNFYHNSNRIKKDGIKKSKSFNFDKKESINNNKGSENQLPAGIH